MNSSASIPAALQLALTDSTTIVFLSAPAAPVFSAVAIALSAICMISFQFWSLELLFINLIQFFTAKNTPVPVPINATSALIKATIPFNVSNHSIVSCFLSYRLFIRRIRVICSLWFWQILYFFLPFIDSFC